MTNTIHIKMQELSSMKVRSINGLAQALNQIQAQINKWFDDSNISYINLSSILMNKLVYYISKEVKKTNMDFIIDTGWYIYGPCYGEGREHEFFGKPITFQPITSGISPEVKSVCNELVPKFLQCDREGKAMSDFLRYIYANKCDQPKLKDFYHAKHEWLDTLYDFKNHTSQDLTEVDEVKLHKYQREYERVLNDGKYTSYIDLRDKEETAVLDFIGLTNHYLNFVIEEQRKNPIIEQIFDFHKTTVLKGVSHLNYAASFDSFSEKYTKDRKKGERKKAHELLARLEEKNRYLSKELFNIIYGSSSI